MSDRDLLMLSVLFVDSGRGMLSDVAGGGAPAFGYALLGSTAAALAGLWWRMARMHEEMQDDARVMSPGIRLKVQMTGDPALAGYRIRLKFSSPFRPGSDI